jgi:hypothetical protein
MREYSCRLMSLGYQGPVFSPHDLNAPQRPCERLLSTFALRARINEADALSYP